MVGNQAPQQKHWYIDLFAQWFNLGQFKTYLGIKG